MNILHGTGFTSATDPDFLLVKGYFENAIATAIGLAVSKPDGKHKAAWFGSNTTTVDAGAKQLQEFLTKMHCTDKTSDKYAHLTIKRETKDTSYACSNGQKGRAKSDFSDVTPSRKGAWIQVWTPFYTKQTLKEQYVTLVHELTHIVLGTYDNNGDNSYGTVNCKALIQKGGAMALLNAENWGYYISEYIPST